MTIDLMSNPITVLLALVGAGAYGRDFCKWIARLVRGES